MLRYLFPLILIFFMGRFGESLLFSPANYGLSSLYGYSKIDSSKSGTQGSVLSNGNAKTTAVSKVSSVNVVSGSKNSTATSSNKDSKAKAEKASSEVKVSSNASKSNSNTNTAKATTNTSKSTNKTATSTNTKQQANTNTKTTTTQSKSTSSKNTSKTKATVTITNEPDSQAASDYKTQMALLISTLTFTNTP